MKKIQQIALIAFLVFTGLNSYSQKKIRIDFQPGSNGDFEIYLKNGLEKIGFEVFINYHNRKARENYDMQLKYVDISYQGMFSQLYLALFDSDGTVLDSAKQCPVAFSRNSVKNTYAAIEKLLGKKVPYEKTEEPRFEHDNYTQSGYTFIVEKMDSAKYIVIARSGNMVTETQLKNALLNHALILNNNNPIKYFSQYSLYGYEMVSGMHTFNYVASQAVASVFPARHLDSGAVEELNEFPDEYKDYIKSKYCFLDEVNIKKPNENKCMVYFLRSTGMNSSGWSFKIFRNGAFLGKLRNNRFDYFEIEPGKHQIHAQLAGKKAKDFGQYKTTNDFEAGKVYFINVLLESKMKTKIYCTEIEEYHAKAMMVSLYEETENRK